MSNHLAIEIAQTTKHLWTDLVQRTFSRELSVVGFKIFLQYFV